MPETSELDLVVKYGGKKGGGSDGQLVIDDVELSQSRDNRVRHGIGNSEPQYIEKGNPTYTFSTTSYMNGAAIGVIRNIETDNVATKAVYMKDGDVFKGSASGMVVNDITVSSSDGGDTTVSIEADLTGVNWTDNTTSSDSGDSSA